MPKTIDEIQDQIQPTVQRRLTISGDPDLFTCGEAINRICRKRRHTADEARQLEKAMRAAIFAGDLGNYDYRTGLLIVPPFSVTTPLVVRMADVGNWLKSPSYKAHLRAPTNRVLTAPLSIVDSPNRSETPEARQARRYQMGVDAGLAMPKTDYEPMPRGIGRLATRETIKRQSFTQDIKAHIRRVFMNQSSS